MEDNKANQKELSDTLLTIKTTITNAKINESYKTLRTNLLYTIDLKVIAITSSSSDEGKTVTAFHLAQSLAGMDKKVLLLDCDLRKSTLYKYLGISKNLPGVSELLLNNNDYIYHTNIDHLDILLSGTRPPNPIDLLSTTKFEETINRLKQEYDFIVIDTPPVAVASDALIVSRIADGTVLVLRNDYISRKRVIRTKTQLLRNDARIVGVVLTRVKRGQMDYYYYDYDYQKN